MSTADDNYTVHRVSLKRTRQACGPCRRKKARCPGEKPTCAVCHRLGQQCTYGQSEPQKRTRHSKAPSVQDDEHTQRESSESTPPDIATSQRFQRIEDRLDKLTSILQESLPRATSWTGPLRRSSQTGPNAGLYDTWGDPPLAPDFMKHEVHTYFAYFHDQPYCVFSKQWLLNRACPLPPEVAFPLVALTSRVSQHPYERRDVPAPSHCSDKAWDILSKMYAGGNMGLSFLQGTFLMAQADFADGRGHRGYASVALGLRTLQSAGLHNNKYAPSLDPSEAEPRKRIAWAFFMLDRSYNASRDYSLCLSDKHFTLPFPDPSTEEPHQGESPGSATLHDGPGKQDEKVDHGILDCLLRLYALWGKVTDFIFGPWDKDALPPWQAGSTFAILESEWLQFETHFADEHRYINVDFQRRAREEAEPRGYLSTWLCVQFLFHSIQCVLHHPFVTMTKLRRMNNNISTTFLQKSHENSLLHSRWIARFIKEMSEVNFALYDPFFGYLAAIAATIQLEHTVSKNPRVALQVNNEFRTLVDFMTQLSTHWECMRVLVDRVNDLAARHRNYGSLYYNRDGYSGALSRMPTPSNIPRMSAEDEDLMWDILDFSSSCTAGRTMHLGDLCSNDQQTGMDYAGFPSTAVEHEATQNRSEYQRPSRVPGISSFLDGRASDPAGDDPMAEWPLPDTNGNDGLWIPDIPDWMILGSDMGQHL